MRSLVVPESEANGLGGKEVQVPFHRKWAAALEEVKEEESLKKEEEKKAARTFEETLVQQVLCCLEKHFASDSTEDWITIDVLPGVNTRLCKDKLLEAFPSGTSCHHLGTCEYEGKQVVFVNWGNERDQFTRTLLKVFNRASKE